MKRIIVRNIGLYVCMLWLFIACSPKNQFTVEGTVANGAGKILYLEHVGISSVQLTDSFRIKGNGRFKFTGVNTYSSPEFYRIRLGNQFINLAIDSTETIEIYTDTLNFAKEYEIKGSQECENIKQLTQLQVFASNQFNQAKKDFEAQKFSPEQYLEKVREITSSYKKNASRYIYENPGSASAYFALFQQVNKMLIYDFYNKEDSKLFGSVSNNWNTLYPDAPRTKHLVNLYMAVLANIKKGEQSPIDWSEYETTTLNAFNFTLRSYNNKEISLSDAVAGKTALLDFTAYGLPESPGHNLLLMELYDKYAFRNFEIFQVSLDSDEHFWKNAASNLPWICVIDPQSIYSKIAQQFNVQSIPCTFLIDRQGEIVKRIDDYSHLEKDILNYLK